MISYRSLALIGGTFLLFSSIEAAETGGDVTRMLAASVCVLGEVPGGRFEASGFVVEPGDYVMTTAHGIGPAKNLRVKLADGRVFAARLERLGNERADIALLSIAGPSLAPAELGSVESVSAGDSVRTVGCPSGFEFSMSQGLVSSVRKSELGYPLIQTDVPVNPGSSGGPLFDRRGRVVGIIKGSVAGRDRIHFALPIDLAKALLDEVRGERRAYELFNQGVLEARVEEKVRLYRDAIAGAPGFAEAHYNLAIALEQLGRAAEAEKHYRDTLRLQPGYERAVLNLGANLYEQKRFAEAAQIYQGALKKSPTSVALRNNLAEAYRAMGRNDEARREFESILKRRPDYAPAHYGLALLYDDDLDDARNAAVHYRRYLALAPDAADAAKVREWLRRAEEKGKR